MTVKPEIVEAVANEIGYCSFPEVRTVIEGYHKVMRERQEEVLKKMIAAECKHDGVNASDIAYGELPVKATWKDIFRGPCERAFNAIFGDEQ